MNKRLYALIFSALAFWPTCNVQGQTATGSISGTVTDASGAVVPSAVVTVSNKATGIARNLATNTEGLYSAPALPAGDYEVRVEVQGFRTEVRSAQVLAGNSTTVNMALTLGATQEVVNVEAASAQINFDSNTVAGSIERNVIQETPLNGRSFLQLGQLEPGVQVLSGATGARNAPVQISILGGATNVSFTTNSTLLTLDGLSLMDLLDGGNTDLNFSQEMVQEFQISSLNFDIATGITALGAVNIVSRGGGNDFHGSGFYFYRDHNMAAYPALKRSPLAPDPYFVRKNPGFYVSGPIKKDRVFFFFNFENINQVNTITFQPDLASLQPLASNYGSPARYHYRNVRLDWRINDKHTTFLRYTHDGNFAFSPETGQPSVPSAWVNLNNWSDQWAMGLTSTLTPNLVNDFRLGWRYWDNREDPPTAAQCQFPCINALGPLVTLTGSSVFSAGVTTTALQRRIARHYEPQDTLSWQKGTHRFKMGGDLDVYVDLWLYGLYHETLATGYAPEAVKSLFPAGFIQNYLPTLPNTIRSTADLQNLPLNITAGYLGNLIIPGQYHQDSERRDLRPKIFFQDTWKVRPNLTVNYGLAWQVQTGNYNSDLPNPKLVAPLLAGNLKPTAVNWFDFGPAFGFTWSPGNSQKTVIRGGAGLYWDTEPGYQRMQNVGLIGPLGNGPIGITSQLFTNTFPGIVQVVGGQVVPVPIGAPVPYGVLTNYTIADWVQTYQAQKGALDAVLGVTPPKSGPYSVTGLDVAKNSAGSYLYPPYVPVTRSYQMSIGVQRNLGHDLVAQADYARRVNVNTQLGPIDLNHYNEFVNGVRTPAIPACKTAPDLNPNDQCSTGSLGFNENYGRAVYNALLVKVQKRFSNHYQFTVSYAYQNLDGLTTLWNLNNWNIAYGPLIPKQNLNVSGVVNLPLGFELTVNSSIISRNPVQPLATGVDITGTNATYTTPIDPTGQYRCFPVNCGKSDLAKYVAAFNATYAGTKQPNGRTIPSFVIPPDYQFGDPTLSQDFRLTKNFSFKERFRLSVFGEAFNAFNIANLTGYSFALDAYNAAACGPLAAGAVTTSCAAQTYAFGKPTQRAGQSFLSSGPRAIQVGARFSF
ncbi:MAG TPA: TonB-dependent receptor [Bryobacteraceae bacterium]|nr:TonB-dependent receptor [Bryobacteraceae bacterium]